MDACTSLYKQCLRSVIKRSNLEEDLKQVPYHVAFDVCHTLFLVGDHVRLEPLLLTHFDKFLTLLDVRVELMKIFQTFQEIKNASDIKLSKKLTKKFIHSVDRLLNSSVTEQEKLPTLQYGSRLGIFLSDVAWYQEAHNVLATSQRLCCSLSDTPKRKVLMLDFCRHLIRVQASYSFLQAASETYQKLLKLIDELENNDTVPNLTAVYTNIAYYFFQINNFQKSFEYSVKALECVNNNLPPTVIIDALRQASKSFVSKRYFVSAKILIEQAINLALETFGPKHTKYADTQIDYGFFLLNHDCIRECIPVYEIAIEIKKEVFYKYNVHMAMAFEDFAYALYVYEYSSGVFDRALELAKTAIEVMQAILPNEHIMISSAQRVKALILEEIAIDDSSLSQVYLKEAEALHLRALRLGRQHFGEMNVLTAKHYGNLGRLYQTMRQYDKAERMHLKAISIKETILGPNDYEVGLSLGHLASLYNYHMELPQKALVLYMRSIDISLRLFGPEYSGLEYDYRGLIHVYSSLHQREHSNHYNSVLINWRLQRERQKLKPQSLLVFSDISLESAVNQALEDVQDSTKN